MGWTVRLRRVEIREPESQSNRGGLGAAPAQHRKPVQQCQVVIIPASATAAALEFPTAGITASDPSAVGDGRCFRCCCRPRGDNATAG